jgi:hypothetical protein
MGYFAIISAAGGAVKAIQPYDQSMQAVKARIDIKNGVCRALVVFWLKSKRDDTSFWGDSGTEKETLLGATQRLQASVDLQKEYEAAFSSRYVPDAATAKALGDSGLKLDFNDIVANSQWGYAVTNPLSQPLNIATKVKNGDARFFILSIKGDSGAHSIGIYRDWKMFGPDQIYIFDPNFGEFNTEGIDNTAKLISAIQSPGYAPLNVDLNKSYISWSYAT